MNNDNSKRVTFFNGFSVEELETIDYDYVIIGAGISGYTLGYLLKKEGKSVLIIQSKDKSKKDTLLGGFAVPKAYKLLSNIFTEEDAKSVVSKKHSKCYAIASIDFPINGVELYSIDKEKLEEMISKKYKELGGECWNDADEILVNSVKKIVYAKGKNVKYKYLVASDGIQSEVRYSLKLMPSKYYTAIDLVNDIKTEDLIIEFKDDYKGYTWIIPSNYDVHIGVMCMEQKDYNVAKSEFEKLLKKYNISSEEIQNIRVPTGEDILLKSSKFDTIYFIGEAAGLTSPIIGKGLYLDLFSAKMLAKSFIKNMDYEKLMAGELSEIRNEFEFSKTVFDPNARKKYVGMLKSNNFITRKLKEQAIKKAMEYISN